jgi:hypothetical protein
VTTSIVQICNLALDAIATRSSIADINEGSTEANACLRHYEPALEAVLQAAHWNFARRQIAMTVLADASAGGTVPAPWVYSYAIPSDMVQGRYVLPTTAASVGTPYTGARSPAVRFLLTSDLDANNQPRTVVLTNQPQATLVYTARITNVSLFDGQFVDAFALYLGARLAMPLTGDRAKGKDAFEMARALTLAAQVSNGNEGLTILDSVPDWVAARDTAMAFDFAFPAGSTVWQAPIGLSIY